MSQKKPLDKINSLDIFSTAVKLEHIDHKETKITKDIISGGSLSKNNNDKITEYMKQANEMLIQKQKQSPYFSINKDNTKTSPKGLMEEKGRKVVKNQEKLNKFEQRINEPDNIEPDNIEPDNISSKKKNNLENSRISSKNNLENSRISSKNNLENRNILNLPYNLIQLGGGPKQFNEQTIHRYINLHTGLPKKNLREYAYQNKTAIFIYKIDSSYSLDLIPVDGLKAGTGAIFQNYKLTEYGKDYITKNNEQPRIVRTAPFNTLYYEVDYDTNNQFMIKLGNNGLLINMRSNSINYNRTIVQNMLTTNTTSIISPGDILFFNKMSNAEKTGLVTNEDISKTQSPPVHPSKFIQLRDNSRTETILNLRREIMPICYTERHYEYLNYISRYLPTIDFIPRLTYLYDKYPKIIENLTEIQRPPDSLLTTAIKAKSSEEISRYINILADLLGRSKELNDQLDRLTQHVQLMVRDQANGTLYRQLLKICSAQRGAANMRPHRDRTPNYLEIDDNRHQAYQNDHLNGPPRYCQNVDEKNKPTKRPQQPHLTHDTQHQDCMMNKKPWTGKNGQTYTANCEQEIHEQYVWAMKEMSMISSRCPKSVNDDTDQELYASDKLDHMLNSGSYNLWELPQTSPLNSESARFLGPIGGAGAFVHNSNYNDDTINKYRTLYRGSSFNMFPVGQNSFVCKSYTSTSSNVGNTIRTQFLPNNGYFYVLKLAKDVPYIPLSGQNPHSARTCYPNEEEILLPPGCRFTLKNMRRGINLSGSVQASRRRTITIYAVYVDYINTPHHIQECNNYIAERSPFRNYHREPPVENLFKNEMRIPYDLLNNTKGIEQDTLQQTFSLLSTYDGDKILKSYPPLDATSRSLEILSTRLTNFWRGIIPNINIIRM